MDEKLYFYKAKVLSVYDGDTCRVDIDLGLKIWLRNERIRLNRINTPELRGAEKAKGLLARDYLRELVLDKDILLQTAKDKQGKYGRYLGELWIQIDGEWQNVNDMLVQNGFAEYKEY
ncbi:MAG: thermonuclease family protein [bacterium]